MPAHLALPARGAGLVEVWTDDRAETKPRSKAWDAPFERVGDESAGEARARSPARSRAGSRAATPVAASAVPCAGDVLMLVRQRGPLFEAIIRALKNAGIPVAGADRLMLTEHIAVMDLMALADALLCRRTISRSRPCSRARCSASTR